MPLASVCCDKMPYRESHYRWEYDLKSEPQDLWSLVADTNRFNRDAGLPQVESVDKKSRRLRFSKYGIPVEWEEQPFEWAKPFRLGVARKYSKGPLAGTRAGRYRSSVLTRTCKLNLL